MLKKAGRVVAIFVVMVWPRALAAQVPTPPSDVPLRPYGGIYGGNPANSAGLRQSLEATVSLFGGHDWNDESEGFDSGLGDLSFVGGAYGSIRPAVGYAWRGRRASFGASASGEGRYQRELQELLLTSRAGGVGFEAAIGRRAYIQAQQSIAFTPLFGVNPFPTVSAPELGQVTAPNADISTGRRNDTLSYATTAGVTHQLGNRGSLGAGFTFSEAKFTGDSVDSVGAGQDFSTRSLTARADYLVARGRRLATTYLVSDTNFVFDEVATPARTHRLDAGLQQDWVHSRTRRTTLQLTAGATLVESGGEQFTRPVGDVQMGTMIGRSWTVGVRYGRGVDAIPGFANVTTADAIGASLNGLLSDRLEVGLQASFSRGDVGFGSALARYESSTGTVRLGVAVSRMLAVFSELFYYQYAGAGGTFAGEVGGRLTRYGIRVGMGLWAPIIRDRRQS